jgi:NADPH-dependent 2,4-dienoyl-CoA reductase/sulfur reductase-like enzyme
MTHIVIIGGSDAGISAALRAREVESSASVTVIVADRFPNYSICGLPFYLSGEVPDWHNLAHRTNEEITAAGISLLLNHTAQVIDPTQHRVTMRNADGQLRDLEYDRLVIATGAFPIRPPIQGLDLPGVYLLRSMEDSFAVHTYLNKHAPRSAIIVGGGYIGLEMADALTLRGIAVTVVEHGSSVLKTVDTSLGEMVSAELRKHCVEVVNGVAIEQLKQVKGQVEVLGSYGFQQETEMVLVAVGVQPSINIARYAGVAIGEHGAICVTRTMKTNVPDVYAAGDCVETWHRLLKRPTYLPLGTTAHKQGRVAGENATGGKVEFAGSLGTQAVKVFDLVIARTGLRESEAHKAGFAPLTVESRLWDHKVYYPGVREIVIRITGDRKSGRLLGAQMVGYWQAEVAKRIDIFATALFHEMLVDELNQLDLSYTPPVSSPWDPVQMSAQAWARQNQ